MKIEGSPLHPISSIQATNRMVKPADPSAMEYDSLAISDNTQLYQALTKKTSEMPVVREDVVNKFKKQIAAGEFKIDSQQVAGKMLDFQI